jgi:hypothetical protein
LVLADRVTAANGPALDVFGLRDAVQALELAARPGHEQFLVTALHSSSFQVRLSVALALIRRRSWKLIERNAKSWMAEAESLVAEGATQHKLGLALWFCPHLASADPASGDDLYARGLRLAAGDNSNPLMFEISLVSAAGEY